MSTKLKAVFTAGAIAAAVNFTTPGQAFAVWCQADAPQVYENMINKYMPFLQKVVGGTGLGMEGAAIESGAAVRAETLKAAAADKAVAEGIEAYSQQQDLRTRAADLSEAMQQPAQTCQALATSANLGSANQSTQAATMKSQSALMGKISASNTTNSIAVLETSFRASSKNFCTPEEQAQGICSVATGGELKNLSGADRNAAFMFQSADGSSSFENSAQTQAADAYIERVVGGLPPQALGQQGEAYYKKSPQARVYTELSRRYSAMLSIASYALQQNKEQHRTIKGLGTDTMLADVSAGGFTAGKADMSMAEAIERFVASKFSPENVTSVGNSVKSNLILRDMAQMSNFQLWMSYQAMQQSSRTEALMAHQLALLAEDTLKPQMSAQRAAATRAAK